MEGSADEKTLDCWEIVHIPERPPISPDLQPTVDVLASAIDAKHAHAVVRKLNNVAPLEGLRHVKRIKKTSLDGGKSQLFVMLCMASGINGGSNHIPEDVLGLMNTYQYASMRQPQRKNGKNNASCGQLPSIHPLSISMA